MDRKHFHTQAHYYLAIMIALCLPFVRPTPIFIVLMLLNWIIEGDFKNKFSTIFKNKFSLFFIGFFLMHVIGLAYTENMDAGLFDLQVKLSLFIFPIILVSRPFNTDQIRKMFVAFIVGGIICSFVMLTRAVYTYVVLSENNFFYQAFSFFIHPSYLSMYFNLSIVWLLYSVFNPPTKWNRSSTIISFLVIFFFSFIIVLLSSKMGLITMVVIYLGFMIYFIVRSKKYLMGIVGLFIIVASVFAVVRFVPAIEGRINAVFVALSSAGDNHAEKESTAVRMLIWSAANKVVTENFLLGAGTGDAKDELVKEYEKEGMTGAIEHKLNAHNEFYQVFVSIGVIGFLIFIACLFWPLFRAFRSYNVIYALFLLIIITNYFPESMLETQAGVMFYAFFNSLLCFCTNFVPNKTNSL